MFRFGKKKLPVTSGDFYKQIASATSEEALAQIMIKANEVGLLTDDMKSILYEKKDQFDEITAKELRESTRAQISGYWDKSPDDNAREAREWNDKSRKESLDKFKSQLESLDLGQLYSLEYNERRKEIKKSGHFCNDGKLKLINERLSLLNKERG